MLKTKDFNYSAVETKLAIATNSDFEVREAAQKLLNALYRPDTLYRSTGVTLKYLTYGEEVQQSLFETLKHNDDKLSHIIDDLEAKFGRGIVKTGV